MNTKQTSERFVTIVESIEALGAGAGHAPAPGFGDQTAGNQGRFPGCEQPFVTGTLVTAAGPIPKVDATLKAKDHWGSIKARWGVGRMNYTVDPGLYALGTPDEKAPVLVTANYKMSFDALRSALFGRSAWILVLDTKGINVWCAAGKGTFGTDELVGRIQESRLETIVSHRRLILPQLGAPGIAAHRVKKASGFKVIYGPIRATDLPRFMDAGFKATPEMRIKRFPLRERAVLIPIELVSAMKWMILILPVFYIIGRLSGPGTAGMAAGVFAVLMLCGGLIAGAVFTPMFLPWLPGRAFSLKGLAAGVLTLMIIAFVYFGRAAILPGLFETIALFLTAVALSTFLAMNFTGASTYTSLSGVKKEMKWAVPAQIVSGAAGILLWLGSLYVI